MFEKDRKNKINEKELEPYLNVLKDLKNLEYIWNNKKLEDSILEKVYKSNIHPDKIYGDNHDIRRIRVRPAFLKPVIVFLSLLLFFSLSFAGTVYASAGSLPGDALYNVKRTYESVQIAFTPYANEGKLYFNFLNKRIYEVDTLLNRAGTIDEEIIENLLSEIDYNYDRCMEHNSFGENNGKGIGRRIDDLRETFHRRRGNKYNSSYSNGTRN